MRGLLSAAALAAMMTPAYAQDNGCMARADLMQRLGERFGESLVATGLADDGSLLEVIASGGGATWSMIATKPGGKSCLVASGKSWEPQKWLLPAVSPEFGDGL